MSSSSEGVLSLWYLTEPKKKLTPDDFLYTLAEASPYFNKLVFFLSGESGEPDCKLASLADNSLAIRYIWLKFPVKLLLEALGVALPRSGRSLTTLSASWLYWLKLWLMLLKLTLYDSSTASIVTFFEFRILFFDDLFDLDVFRPTRCEEDF